MISSVTSNNIEIEKEIKILSVMKNLLGKTDQEGL